MTKERPILFSDRMVCAILEGRKTQTRRVVKQQDVLDSRNEVGVWDGPGEVGEWEVSRCPYGQVGDRLWVREAWHCDGDPKFVEYNPEIGLSATPDCFYRATEMCRNPNAGWRWRPSIHMPRWASRITLEITGVRVERLQDISEEDAKAEGVELIGARLVNDDGSTTAYTHKMHFEALWDSINEDRGYSWESNPWVWVVNFKRIES